MNAIDGIDFNELESEKYWSFPKTFRGDVKEEVQQMIFSGNYLGALKIDGAYFRFTKDMEGNMELHGRSRNVNKIFLNKIGHVPHLQPFFDAIPNGTCLLGELYFPNNEGSSNVTTIIGCKEEKAIQRQEKGKKLHYYIFDVWAYNGSSFMNNKAEDRFDFLKNGPISSILERVEGQYVELAEYFSGAEIWEKLQDYLGDGREGMVLTKKGSRPEPGKRTARKTLKVKKEVKNTLDVIILGANPPTRLYSGKQIEEWPYWINIYTSEKINKNMYKEYRNGEGIEPVTKSYFNNWAGSLKIGVYKGDKLVQIGSLSGLDEEILKNWREYIGKVAEISAMEVLETQGLRHPKFVQWRPDLKKSDCTWEKIYG